MFTFKQCTNITYHNFGPENHTGSGFITCDMGNPLKSSWWGESKGREDLEVINSGM